MSRWCADPDAAVDAYYDWIDDQDAQAAAEHNLLAIARVQFEDELVAAGVPLLEVDRHVALREDEFKAYARRLRRRVLRRLRSQQAHRRRIARRLYGPRHCRLEPEA